jgi:hypothetical protein
MGNGKWIWYPGDYEIWHSLLLHGRRYERGAHIPCQWSLSTPYPNVSFTKEIELEKAAEFTCHATVPGVVTVMTGQFPRGKRVTVPTGTPVTVEPGRHRVSIQIQKVGGLPAAYIDSELIWTDDTWDASHATRAVAGKAACEPAYTRPDDNPEIFPFAYEKWEPVETRAVPGGMLFDFGRETFAKLRVEDADPASEIRVQYGESEAETLDPNCVISETVSGSSSYDFPAYAFRYVTLIADQTERLRVFCDYEYLPLENRASFECDVPEVKKVFDVCVHTFHLNCREFFLDGIKRDRWVWSGDAYQSALVNQYLFFDPAITRRTIRALLGKPPYEQHINCINDYSAYLIIMVWDYYAATGDAAFVRQVFPRVRALYDFIATRLDENGLVVGRPDDWVFIDWARFDREGPLCAEQILLWKVYDVMAKLSALAGEEFRADPDALRDKIEGLYWDAEKGAYIDGYVSGKKNVTRHANAFAILYGFAPEKADLIAENVLLNDKIDPITTPYFKFFELMALCRIGNVEKAQEMILTYWYPMLELGATAIWEQFDPRETGVQHYSMYGDPYGRSLCHAWGAGPACLLGRYVAGVEATGVAYETFDVAPRPGTYRTFDATVPVFGGTVRVQCDADARTVRATATRDGGTLKFGGREVLLSANQTATIRWEE